ncbi:hypothetical protein IAR55_002479 [Kwoniella newhampshirensis]|uniref:Cation efflux protein transmembrane domain-containing protein n=1 Tax=Kwoniella newhampshirensis TaxID=1651941 RepID=A0AAW0Z135_9TREE
MQAPPPPTPLQRTSLPVPLRRTTLGTGSGPTSRQSRERPNSFLRLFVGALAVTASEAWVLNIDEKGSGGVGWLVLAYWAARMVSEIKEVWEGRKKRAKDGAVERLGARTIAASAILSFQTVSFFLSLQKIGPLRLILIAFASSLPASTDLPDLRSLVTLLPAAASTVYIAGEAILTHGIFGAIPLIVFAVSTFLADRYLSKKSSKARSDDKKFGGQETKLWLLGTCTACSSAILIILYTLNTIPLPIPVAHSPSQRFGSLLSAFLVRFIPFPFTTSPGSEAILRLSSLRDKIIFLVAIPVLQFFALHPAPTMIDVLVLLPLVVATLVFATAHKAQSDSVPQGWSFPAQTVSTSRPSWSIMSLVPSRWRPHLQTILNTPTSSKIFYFLLLNLAYMGVQMVYGVFTNSLGLISDAIHMLFDCLGLAVGLWASVAATWKPDGRYTFGYSRVETLSGFANGCFLILISIFIIFEAIQRVIDPPEMETHQLLLVSGIGLAINLWGMYATGGHHHHGHSHGHDHSHVPVNDKKEDHRHEHTSHHKHNESHGTSQAIASRPHGTLGKRRSSGFLNGLKGHDPGSHGQIQSHSRNSSRTHSPVDHIHDDHSNCNGHTHDVASHTHSHDHPHGHHSHDHQDHDHGHDHDHDHDHDHLNHDPHHHGHDHGHGHDHAHSHNMRGVFLHVLADTLGSVGVIISTILIRFTGWTGFDPIASLFIAALIMASVFPLVIDSGKVLCLDVGVDKEAEIRNALAELSSVDGLANYASPRFWPRCEGELVGSIHIHLAISPSSVDPTRLSTPYPQYKPRSGDIIYANAEKVVGRVERLLKKRIRGLTELVVQIEGGAEERSFCTCMTGGLGR